ncbi:hypothetical protein [Staphylococcus americanisciuri]|uniref:XRE family transcriptional regulator n=1 Tax=Staphylococcus americanisciuri TaxID=2973940 RepID=A0ABT2F2M3_9STAP|nr:hypothetical protein [Staphylococcus americanisciuri]MCS4486650.1 hypothetical protein [Staphylococcus americanisciuri]
MRKHIEALLKRNISSNSIATHTGVSQAIISKLRNGKRPIKNLTIETGEKLVRYEKELERIENKIE